MRNNLVAALVACADRPKKLTARRFLLGLSADELQFIAAYLGACILECGSRVEPPEHAARIPRPSAPRIAADLELKLILLREYLRRAGVRDVPASTLNHAVN